MNPTATTAIQTVVQYLVAANTALPVILDTVAGIAMLIRGATGSGPSVAERAEIIRAEVAKNDAYGKAEIARLEALIASAGA